MTLLKKAAALPLLLALVALGGCASSSPPQASPGPEPVTPADFVASIADVAAGRNPAIAEAGLVLKRIEFRLAVGTETKGGGKIEVLLLDAETSRSTETSFVEELTLEIPAAGGKRAAAPPLVPGAREFVDAAMNTARDLARAATAAGLPQRLRSVELTAKITRSKKAGGGIAATIPAWVKPSVGAEAQRGREEENTVKMVFEAANRS
ncbi:MAG TPA: hypothetical protein VN032_10950 [Thermoanaerobaculia bacterium]|jgi:hypothetical protein|nr:hypothetical protein [Thermoanaerobaculia bacterium]